MTATRFKPYFEKLKDPRWQQRRLHVLEAAKFECEWCGGKDKTLHVHHEWYESGKDPWDYPDAALSCYCEDCHAFAEAQRLELLKRLAHSSVSSQILIGILRCAEAEDEPGKHPYPEDLEQMQGWELWRWFSHAASELADHAARKHSELKALSERP